MAAVLKLAAGHKMLNLGDLADPRQFRDPINLRNENTEALLQDLDTMLRIRRVELAIAALVRSGEAACPCHLAVGQEAVSVGVARHLRKTDRCFGNHRSHGHYLALGGAVGPLIAEILGKASGCSKGMGGSMHLYGGEFGFMGSVPIVAGTIPIAAGAALAAKFSGQGDVAVAYFGDGACEEGVVHETLNMAAAMKLPVLFVVENNLFSSHLDLHLRQPATSMSRFAEAHCIRSEVVDGNDVVSVAQAADSLIAPMRSGAGPGLLEAVTYRWLGHVGPNEDVDVGVHRSLAELNAWKKRDPIHRLEQSLVSARGVAQVRLQDIRAAIDDQVEKAVEAARAAEYPKASALLEMVYKSPRRAQESEP
ncbi:thiamine pyrophosphate-dependent dehydrogenase E1 component subunit alpha [Bradyrhizobium sp. WSM471]|uniref:thiamine pyrophosphate-dependent dehydrogenase E1 component subunit alpha n=2 Tax=Bradyrhizobium sp. WSM471 TaxID=319017 RepID=UPI0018DEDF38|nr:thiamine pyrophosphate-dependent dehydrogenase E1 component subunit alpha [Bradyrhizobium canariense]UFW39779.1 thiamine pyrophosphate-dependent dehydrogenase E1 component subunit alpha [Bradyrhizobium canariense]